MRFLSVAAALILASGLADAADDFKPEPGFLLLFPGKSLDGWQTQGARPAPLDGKDDAFKGRFKLMDGILTIDPGVKGDVRIETSRKFGTNTVIRFEFKPDAKCNNDLFWLGTKFDITLAAIKSAKVDEWNTMEIAVKDGKAVFTCNGQMVRAIATKGESSTFAIRAEFGAIAIRRLRASEGK